jgi:hypothetical protein
MAMTGRIGSKAEAEIPPSLRVTFDTNVLDLACLPERFPEHPRQPLIANSIRNGPRDLLSRVDIALVENGGGPITSTDIETSQPPILRILFNPVFGGLFGNISWHRCPS